MNIQKVNSSFKTNQLLNYVTNPKQKQNTPNVSNPASVIYFKGAADAAKAYAIPQINTVEKAAKESWDLIKSADNIVIYTHEFSDPDGITTGLVLMDKIEEEFPDKKVSFYVPGGAPSTIKDLQGIEKITNIHPPFQEVNLGIALDCDETNLDGYDFYKRADYRIRIDHHNSKNNKLKELLVIDSNAPSTTEILYNKFIKPLDLSFSSENAKSLLTGLMTDTGNFKFGNQELALKVKNELLAYGHGDFSVESINGQMTVNNVKSKEIARLKKFLLNEKQFKEVITGSNDVMNCVTVSKKLLQRFKVLDSNPDIKANFRDVTTELLEKADIGILFWEIPNSSEKKVHVSMRSNDILLSEFAKEHGGGGHANAAGFFMHGDLNTVKSELIEIFRKYKFKKMPKI